MAMIREAPLPIPPLGGGTKHKIFTQPRDLRKLFLSGGCNAPIVRGGSGKGHMVNLTQWLSMRDFALAVDPPWLAKT
jgi:hypothetical protein